MRRHSAESTLILCRRQKRANHPAVVPRPAVIQNIQPEGITSGFRISAGVALTSARLAFGQKRQPVEGGRGFPVPDQAWTDRLLTYTHESFEPYIGSIFTTPGPWRSTIELTLISVTPYAPKKGTRITTGNAPVTECFALMFNATASLPKISTIFPLNHAALGKLDLFLKESRGQQGEILYEAVVNHIR